MIAKKPSRQVAVLGLGDPQGAGPSGALKAGVDHQRLYEASGNRFLARALEDMYDLIYRLFFFALDRMGSVRDNVEEHWDIVAALKAGDGRAAERIIQHHIAHFQRMVEELT